MADLIERYKITANLPSVMMNYCNRFNSEQIELITEMIYELENSIESADVQPVKRGKWKHVAGMNSKCSVCSHYFPVIEFDSRPFDINFCPNCGARMDLGDEKT